MCVWYSKSLKFWYLLRNMTTSPYKLRLQSNYTAVIKDLEPEKVLDYLFQDGIVDLDDMDDVKSEKTRKKRAVTLIEKVLRSGSQSLECFINALGKTQTHLYDLLQQPIANENQLQQANMIASFSGLHMEPPLITAQKAAATPVEQGHLPPELGKTEKGSSICVTEEEHNFVHPTDLSRVPAHNHPGSDGVYKMYAKPRGVALIINNEEFTPESELTKKELEMRYGSKKDVEKLQQLFEALDFKVQINENQTKGEILKILDDTANDKELDNYDCFVLWLMSHGENGLLYCTDGKTLHIETVRDMFNNANCFSLRGKPKLFFIQACRGKLRDSGVVADSPGSGPQRQPSTGDDTSAAQTESSDVGWKFNISDSIPGHADILMAHSTVGGFASFRNTDKGSRFVRCLVEVFREYAGYEDLVSMLTIVNDRVSKMGELGSKQVSQPEHTLRKKLFFWPGLDLQSSDLF